MILSVLVTSLNEAKTILRAVEEAKQIEVPDKEIIVVDNGSTDGTRELLQGLQDRSLKMILNDKNEGFGWSIEKGLFTAQGKYIYVHHADCEYDYRCVPSMIRAAEEKQLDIVLGSRTRNLGLTPRQLMKQRPEYLATIISTGLINLWYNKSFTDIIGSRLYRTETIRKVAIDTYGPGFDFESITRICKSNLNIDEIGIGYNPRECHQDKKIKPYHMLNALTAMFKVRYFEPK